MAKRWKTEADYQAYLIIKIHGLLPGCLIVKNDAGYRQGIPDLSIFWYEFWAMLEVKRSAHEPYQPNQFHYLARTSEMSWSATIYPENEEAVLNELQKEFESRRQARLP
jgi:hypothetical protein